MMIQRTPDNPAAGPGQVENLADLAREAATLQAGEQAESTRTNQASQQAEQQATTQSIADAVRELTDVLRVGRDLAADFADVAGIIPKERTVAIWHDKALESLAGPLLVLADRHGSQLGAFLEKHGPYVALIAAAAMPTMTTVKAVRAHKALTVSAREVPAEPSPGGGLGR